MLLLQWAARQNLRFNQAKEYLWAPTVEGLRALRTALPEYQGTLAKPAPDLGLLQRSPGQADQKRTDRLVGLRPIFDRIRRMPIGTVGRSLLVQQVAYARGLYGCEVTHVAQRALHSLET